MGDAMNTTIGTLAGALTERDLPEAEHEFPGITWFFAHCPVKPTTFLELVFAFTASSAS
jgi:hypothetical protein